MASANAKILAWTAVVAAAHTAGIFFLYNATGWFDNLVHFLGGVWLFNAAPVLIKRKMSPAETVLAVLVAALLWENFEGALNWYAVESYGYVTPVGGGTLDTFLDIVLGTLGALTAASCFRRRQT
ncbi:MAG TPA: hypothetical protein VNK70_03070 [Candidatus Paceibacterota bacterium]|nr:hypothetical protein [Candidatus Paceibacterota bacterium]